MAERRFLSLFSGAGGLDLGFSEAGFKCALAVDYDRAALSHHETNLGVPTLEADLSKPLPLGELEGIDVIVSGPPCQGFSTLGPRDPMDPRNELLQVPAVIARDIRPKVVVIENVVGARSAHNSHHLDRVRSELGEQGYDDRLLELDMRNAGLPQARRRIVLVAWRTDVSFDWDQPTEPASTLASVLESVHEVGNHAPAKPTPGSASHLIATRIGQGQKLTNVRQSEASVPTWEIPEVFGPVTETEVDILRSISLLRRRNRRRSFGDADPVSARTVTRHVGYATSRHLSILVRKGYLRRIDSFYDLTHTFNGKYRRADPAGIAPTVDGRFGDFRYFLHPTENRAYSVREAARIQGFPDWYRFQGAIRTQFQIIANAVPPPAAAQLAHAVKSLL